LKATPLNWTTTLDASSTGASVTDSDIRPVSGEPPPPPLQPASAKRIMLTTNVQIRLRIIDPVN
jgi:hypothetical protein